MAAGLAAVEAVVTVRQTRGDAGGELGTMEFYDARGRAVPVHAVQRPTRATAVVQLARPARVVALELRTAAGASLAADPLALDVELVPTQVLHSWEGGAMPRHPLRLRVPVCATRLTLHLCGPAAARRAVAASRVTFCGLHGEPRAATAVACPDDSVIHFDLGPDPVPVAGYRVEAPASAAAATWVLAQPPVHPEPRLVLAAHQLCPPEARNAAIARLSLEEPWQGCTLEFTALRDAASPCIQLAHVCFLDAQHRRIPIASVSNPDG